MGKVSIGMLGWRFDEEEILDDDGEFLPFEEMAPGDRKRIVRLGSIYNAPCNACWLIHGDADLEECNTAKYVYGEPLDEVVLCEEHEPDFVYWFRQEGGDQYRGTDGLEDAFFEWFADGGRAPEGYEGMEYVETDPDNLPEPPTVSPDEHPELTEEAIADSGVDLDPDYPS